MNLGLPLTPILGQWDKKVQLWANSRDVELWRDEED